MRELHGGVAWKVEMDDRYGTAVLGQQCVTDLRTAEPDLALVGGKGANLVGLIRAGFAVPAGFCVDTTGYRMMLASGLDAQIGEFVERIDFSDTGSVESGAAT